MEDQNPNIQGDLQGAVEEAEAQGQASEEQPQKPAYGEAQQGPMNFTPQPNSSAPSPNYAGYDNGQNQGQYQNPYQNQRYENYRQTPYPQRPASSFSESGQGLSIAAMICGIVAVLTSLVPLLGIGCGVAGIITSILSRKQSGRFNGMAMAGLICGICGIVFAIVVYGFAFVAILLNGWYY